MTSNPGGNFDSLFIKFRSELSALGGEAVKFQSEDDVAQFVIAHTGNDSSIFIYDEVKEARGAAVDALSESRHPGFGAEFGPGYDKRQLADFEAAVTACAACIAETGTVVFKADMRLPAALAAKLFVIVEKKQLLPSLDDLFTDRFEKMEGSNLFLITGPSRTADIEKQLVKGVHGPKEVYVMFLGR